MLDYQENANKSFRVVVKDVKNNRYIDDESVDLVM